MITASYRPAASKGIMSASEIKVKKLSRNCTKEDVNRIFCRFGQIRNIRIEKNGVCFIKYEKRENANLACAKLNGLIWHGKKLFIEIVPVKDFERIHSFESSRKASRKTQSESNNHGNEMESRKLQQNRLKIIVVSKIGGEIHFKLNMSTKLLKMKEEYAKQFNLSLSSLQYLFKGTIIGNDDTPESLRMKSNDIVNVCERYKSGSRDEKRIVMSRFGPVIRTEYRLAVRNISRRVNWRHLKNTFANFAKVTFACRTNEDEGFVEFLTEKEMKIAKKKLNGVKIDGKKIEVFEEYEFQTLCHWDNEEDKDENLHNDGFVMQDEDALRDESLWRALDV